MNVKTEKESYPAGTARHIILDLLRKTENEWACREIPPTNKNGYTRKIVFVKKENEGWKHED